MSDSDLIQVFRVFVSGVAATFDDMDLALSYMRSQALHNRIDQLHWESSRIKRGEYVSEVEEQEVGT